MNFDIKMRDMTVNDVNHGWEIAGDVQQGEEMEIN